MSTTSRHLEQIELRLDRQAAQLDTLTRLFHHMEHHMTDHATLIQQFRDAVAANSQATHDAVSAPQTDIAGQIAAAVQQTKDAVAASSAADDADIAAGLALLDENSKALKSAAAAVNAIGKPPGVYEASSPQVAAST